MAQMSEMHMALPLGQLKHMEGSFQQTCLRTCCPFKSVRFARPFSAGKCQVPNKDSTARDHLANERTFLAWLRTGLALSGQSLGEQNGALGRLWDGNGSAKYKQWMATVCGQPGQHACGYISFHFFPLYLSIFLFVYLPIIFPSTYLPSTYLSTYISIFIYVAI